jgi:hypothetical protein
MSLRRLLIIVAQVVITATISVAGVLGLLMHFEVGSQVASGVTRDGLERLRPGMDEQTVVAMIGAPLWEREKM